MARQVVIPGALIVTVAEDHSSDKTTVIHSKPATQKYADGWEALWGATQDGQEEAALQRALDIKTLN